LFHLINDLRLSVDALMDVHPFFPVPQKKQVELAFGIFHSLVIPELYMTYNESILHGNVKILPGQGVAADIVLSGLRLTPFTAPGLDGIASGQIHLDSPESFKDVSLKTELHLSDARYQVDQSRSSPLDLTFAANGRIGLHESTTLDFPILTVRLNNPMGTNLLLIASSANAQIGAGEQGSLKIQSLRVNYADLHATLPGSLRYTLSPYRSYLDGGLTISGITNFNHTQAGTSANTDTSIAIPGMALSDLRIQGGVNLSRALTVIDSFKITGLRGALSILANGTIKHTPSGAVPDLTVSAGVSSPSLFAIHKNISLQGGLAMDFKIAAAGVRGNVNAKDLSLEIIASCEEGNVCKKYRFEKVNLTLPIFHDVHLASPAVLTDSPVGQTFDGTTFRGQPNLVVNFIASTHNPRGEYIKTGYFYAGSLLPGRDPGITALIEYRKNVFYIKWLRYSMYRPKARTGKDVWVTDGRIDGSDLFFNLADLTLRRMEFGGAIQIESLDLEPFLAPTSTSYDGKVDASLTFRGRDLTNPLYNTDAKFAVYHLSRDISGFAARIAIPAIIAVAANRTLEIPSVTVELQNGLVYSSIGIAKSADLRSAITFLIKPTGEEIRQERIPLAEFLERAKAEANAGVKAEGVTTK